MNTPRDNSESVDQEPAEHQQNSADFKTTNEESRVLEICFGIFLTLVVLWAFIESFSYDIVSSRTPFVIMVPLLLLLAMHLNRLRNTVSLAEIRLQLSTALKGGNSTFNRLANLFSWMAFFAVGILILGHYPAMLIFVIALLLTAGRRDWKLIVLLGVVTTVVIFILFEFGFNIELYRGLILRYFTGYNDF
ncbi:MAG: hypothetical protein KTR35_15960 [Gammaproteobacteria bacterium]|nr:hypothetical protein [Gammaproteobacteria bacterium]